MAVRVATATGLWSAAATWKTTNATASLLSTSIGTTALTASNQNSAAFAPGAITLDAIAVRVASRGSTASPTNNLILTLRNSSDSVDVASATIPVSYIPNTTTGANQELQPGWILWKIGSTTLLAGKNYILQARLDATTTAVSLYTNGTAANWQRITRLTTTGAPAAGDEHYILEEWTAGGVTALTVTMDSTAATDYGTGTFNLGQPAIVIGKNCTLAFGSTAATNYQLKVSGAVFVQPNGTFTIGTTGTPIPRDSTALLLLDTTANSAGLHIGPLATFSAVGLSRTSGKDQWGCLLSANAAGGATALTVDTDTGWLNGDEIALGSTTEATPLNAELATLNADAGASSLSLSAGLGSAKSGTNGVQSGIVLISRNVSIEAASTVYADLTVTDAATAVTLTWVRLLNIRGRYNVGTIRYCAFKSTSSAAVPISSGASAVAVSPDLRYCGFYVNNGGSIFVTVAGANPSLQDLIVISDVAASIVVDIRTTTFTIAGLRIHGGATAFYFLPAINPTDINLSGLTVFAATTAGVNYDTSGTITGGTLSNIVCRLCNVGIEISPTVGLVGLTLDGCEGSGAGQGIYLRAPTRGAQNIRLVDCITSSLGAASASSFRVDLEDAVTRVRSVGHRFGGTVGGVTYMANGIDVEIGTSVQMMSDARIVFENAIEPATTFAEDGAMNLMVTPESALVSLHHGAVGVEHAYVRYGARRTDSTVFRTAAPSEAVYPVSVTQGVHSSPKFVALTNGASCTVGVWVRRSSVGVTPRLMVGENNALGITADTVLATISVGADTWEQLSGIIGPVADDGCAEVWVEAACAAGPVFYVDDWTVA